MGSVHVKLSDSPALYAPSGLLALAQNRARQPSPSGVEVASISQVAHCSAIVPPAYNRSTSPGTRSTDAPVCHAGGCADIAGSATRASSVNLDRWIAVHDLGAACRG